jgi:hypothetical protein
VVGRRLISTTLTGTVSGRSSARLALRRSRTAVSPTSTTLPRQPMLVLSSVCTSPFRSSSTVTPAWRSRSLPSSECVAVVMDTTPLLVWIFISIHATLPDAGNLPPELKLPSPSWKRAVETSVNGTSTVITFRA